VWPERAALVGPKLNGRIVPTVVLEATAADVVKNDLNRDAALWLTRIQGLPGCASIERALFFVAPFPVDRRHNAKIEREALTRWAEQELARSVHT
jgi:hypothetical protein